MGCYRGNKRTEYFLSNPGIIAHFGAKFGVPAQELEDFTQFVYLKSIQYRDDYNPLKCQIQTWCINFVGICARKFLSKRRLETPNQEAIDRLVDM